MTGKQKEALALRASGMTYDAIGKQMGITGAAAYGLVQRSIAMTKTEKPCVYPKIRSRLRELEMRQVDLAEKSGILPESISMYLNGRREPKISAAMRIANCLGMTIEEAFGNA